MRCVSFHFDVWRNENMKDFMAITKALSDPGRVRILLALEPGELCVCQITEMFGLAPSTMSKHLAMLNQAGLVESRKEDRWVYYRLPDRKRPSLVRDSLRLVKLWLKESEEVIADQARLKKIMKMNVKDICRRQNC
jgi:ArsR family transcriptional regulator, arsenate/arsenite/antimonite-responsive transcriptional repressor